jgi:DNA-binding SARP family transcriptional activator
LSGLYTQSRPARSPTGLALRLLSSFELAVDGAPVAVAPGGQRVIALLALGGGRLPRAFVSGVLWPEGSDQRAAASLRSALWRIGLIGDVVLTDGTLLVLTDDVVLDIGDLRARADRLVHDEGPSEHDDVLRLRDAGELLPGWYEDWVIIERERLRQAQVLALEALCVRLSAERRYAAAAEAGLAAVGCDPLRESAHRVLVAAHLAAGNAVEALRQHDLCRHLLRRHLAIAPSAQMAALVAGLRRD